MASKRRARAVAMRMKQKLRDWWPTVYGWRWGGKSRKAGRRNVHNTFNKRTRDLEYTAKCERCGTRSILVAKAIELGANKCLCSGCLHDTRYLNASG